MLQGQVLSLLKHRPFPHHLTHTTWKKNVSYEPHHPHAACSYSSVTFISSFCCCYSCSSASSSHPLPLSLLLNCLLCPQSFSFFLFHHLLFLYIYFFYYPSHLLLHLLVVTFVFLLLLLLFFFVFVILLFLLLLPSFVTRFLIPPCLPTYIIILPASFFRITTPLLLLLMPLLSRLPPSSSPSSRTYARPLVPGLSSFIYYIFLFLSISCKYYFPSLPMSLLLLHFFAIPSQPSPHFPLSLGSTHTTLSLKLIPHSRRRKNDYSSAVSPP